MDNPFKVSDMYFEYVLSFVLHFRRNQTHAKRFLLIVASRWPTRRHGLSAWKLVQPDLPLRRINLSKKASVTTKQRPGFIKLIDRIESGDVLVLTKLDQLGWNAMDVRAFVEQLSGTVVRLGLHCTEW